MNKDKLPNRQCCAYCWEKPTMCQECYSKTLRPTKPVIDWTKPIHNAHDLSSSVRLVGTSHNGNYVIEEHHAGTSHFVIVSQVTGEKIGDRNSRNFLLENIPEPKKEKWINVYWDHDDDSAFTAAGGDSREEALSLKARSVLTEVPHVKYLGTFQVE